MKLSSVATDILGKSGRDMLNALVRGTRDPEVLAELARGKLRAKIPALREALLGRFSNHHALLVSSILAKLDFLEEIIGSLSEEIDRVIAPFGHHVERIVTIPGVDKRVAEALIAEVGVDMAVFGTPDRLASWAGMCPGNHESAGKQRSGRSRKGSQVAAGVSHGGGQGSRAHQEHLLGFPVPTAAGPTRPGQGHQGSRALDPGGVLLHHPERSPVQGARA